MLYEERIGHLKCGCRYDVVTGILLHECDECTRERLRDESRELRCRQKIAREKGGTDAKR